MTRADRRRVRAGRPTLPSPLLAQTLTAVLVLLLGGAAVSVAESATTQAERPTYLVVSPSQTGSGERPAVLRHTTGKPLQTPTRLEPALAMRTDQLPTVVLLASFLIALFFLVHRPSGGARALPLRRGPPFALPS